MTVKQLIAKLKEMPQDAEIVVELLTIYSSLGMGEIDEVYETADGQVNLQGVL